MLKITKISVIALVAMCLFSCKKEPTETPTKPLRERIVGKWQVAKIKYNGNVINAAPCEYQHFWTFTEESSTENVTIGKLVVDYGCDGSSRIYSYYIDHGTQISIMPQSFSYRIVDVTDTELTSYIIVGYIWDGNTQIPEIYELIFKKI